MTDMFFKQVLHDDCGCSSYVVGGKSTGDVAVIDPALDSRDVLELAELRGFKIRYAIDTHIHADHISGARKLADATGAEVAMHRSAGVRFPFRPLDDGDQLALGNVSLGVLHTPGHRPESISLLVTNHARAESPSMVITGDTLLVGDVGRPDFGGDEGVLELWDSLQRLLKLEDYVEVFPSHFDGPCGKGMCGRPSSTIGFERRFNPALQFERRDAFLSAIGTDFGARPLNMEAILATNVGEARMEWAMPAGQPHVPEVLISEAQSWIAARNPLLLDVREASEYAAGHLPGTRNIPQSQLASRLEEIPANRTVLTVCAGGGRSMKAAQFLVQVGRTEVASLHAGTMGWRDAGLPLEK